MERASLLLLSDIHFGQFADSPDFVLNPDQLKHHLNSAVSMKSALIDTLKDQTLDGVLVLGDLTSVGSPAEFAGCMKVVHEIARELSVPYEKVFCSFGNHDLDWDISRLAEKDNDELYYKVAATVGSLFAVNSHPVAHEGPLPGTGVYETAKYILFVVNSGYFCVHDQTHRNGRLGTDQIKWFSEAVKNYDSRDKWRIVMLHHHPFNYPFPTFVEDLSCVAEGAEMVAAIGDGNIDIVCHGHRHHPRLHTEMQTGWASPVTFLCAGSLAVNPDHRNKGEIPNCFHVLHLEDRLEDGVAFGELRTFQYSSPEGWVPADFSPSVPLDGSQKFGALCGELKKTQEAQAVVAAATASTEEAYVSLPAREELPPVLQCLSLKELNTVLATAAEAAEAKMIGKYPDDVILKRRIP